MARYFPRDTTLKPGEGWRREIYTYPREDHRTTYVPVSVGRRASRKTSVRVPPHGFEKSQHNKHRAPFSAPFATRLSRFSHQTPLPCPGATFRSSNRKSLKTREAGTQRLASRGVSGWENTISLHTCMAPDTMSCDDGVMSWRYAVKSSLCMVRCLVHLGVLFASSVLMMWERNRCGSFALLRGGRKSGAV